MGIQTTVQKKVNKKRWGGGGKQIQNDLISEVKKHGTLFSHTKETPPFSPDPW